MNQMTNSFDELTLRDKGKRPLDEQISQLTNEVLAYIVVVIVLFAFAVYEGFRWLSDSGYTPNPVPFILAIGGGAYLKLKAAPIWAHLKDLRQWRDGEKGLTRALERLQQQGYRLHRDILYEQGIIEYLLIGPRGVFTVATKMVSRACGFADMVYDGHRTAIGGRYSDIESVFQAKTEALWVAKTLKADSGRDIPVHGTVVFFGWNIAGSPEEAEVSVLNERTFQEFVENSKRGVAPEDADFAFTRITDYIRSISKLDTVGGERSGH